MSALRTTTAVFLVTALAVLLPRLVWTTIDTYVLGHPDSKFGAAGGIQFLALFVGFAAFVAGLVAAALAFARQTMSFRTHLRNAAVGGVILSLASFWIPDLAVYGVGYTIFGEIGMIVVNWAVVCAVVLLLVQFAIGGSLPPNSTPHTDARATSTLHQPPSARAGERGR
jgi:hypothetical protein